MKKDVNDLNEKEEKGAEHVRKKSRFVISARIWGVIVAVLILIAAGIAMEMFMDYNDRVVKHYDDEGSYAEIIEPSDE